MASLLETAPAEALAADQRAGKYLSFRLGNEEFAFQVLCVREIMGVLDITVVPQTPDFVKGVINLGGKVIPVIDLRLKFGLPEIEYTRRTCIIVVQIQNGAGELSIGVIVDGVSEVLNLQASEIEDTPDFGSGVETPYLMGIAQVKGEVKILLDISLVLSAEEVQAMCAM